MQESSKLRYTHISKKEFSTQRIWI